MANVPDIGWSFPPQFYKPSGEAAGGVAMTADEADIRGSLAVLFSTRRRERLFRPDYGTDLEDFLYSPWDTAATIRMTEMIEDAVRKYEPRIIVRSVDFSGSDTMAGRLNVVLSYSIRGDRSDGVTTETFTLID